MSDTGQYAFNAKTRKFNADSGAAIYEPGRPPASGGRGRAAETLRKLNPPGWYEPSAVSG